MMDEAAMMHIGEVAERVGLSLRTLRHYDDIGLVTASGRSEGGFREYTASDVERLLLVRRMKPLGFSLEEMAELLKVVDAVTHDKNSTYRKRLADYIEDAVQRREVLRNQLDMADEFLALLRTQTS